jgi:hypothetical protein
MQRAFRVLGLFLATFVLLPFRLSAAVEIHISPSGDDSNPGTSALPVKTPQGAQVRVRSLIQAGLNVNARLWQREALSADPYRSTCKLYR